jgi:hypothetical protein
MLNKSILTAWRQPNTIKHHLILLSSNPQTLVFTLQIKKHSPKLTHFILLSPNQLTLSVKLILHMLQSDAHYFIVCSQLDNLGLKITPRRGLLLFWRSYQHLIIFRVRGISICDSCFCFIICSPLLKGIPALSSSICLCCGLWMRIRFELESQYFWSR